MKSASDVVRDLELVPHPEGGFYREVFRDATKVRHPLHGRERSAVTSIYFLLPAGTFSAFHRVAQTEIWHHLDGDPVRLHTIENGVHREILLDRRQHVVATNSWQAAEPGENWSLCACTVAPGFDFEDFAMPSRAAMLKELPHLADLVTRLTR